MKISKELIEKYHNGTCSETEKSVVEDWLHGDESDENLLLPDEEKQEIQMEMWREISSSISLTKEPPVLNLITRYSPIWIRMAAAVLIFSVFACWLYVSRFSPEKPGIVVMRNTSETLNKNFNQRNYTISIGPKSNVEINSHTGMIDFCGAMMINPKEDMEFTIQGICSGDADGSEKMKLKKGLNYIALNYSSPENPGEVIILEEGSMMELPPMVMKQLINQFDI